MVTLLVLMLLDCRLDVAGGFSFEVHSPVPVTVTVGGVEVKPNTLYLVEPGTYKVTFRYHGEGDEYTTEEHVLTLTAGRTKRFTIRVPMPPTAVVRHGLPSPNG